MANLTLNGKTYTGAGVANGIASYVERSSGVASGFSPLTASVRPGSGNSPSKVAWKMKVPVVAGALLDNAGQVLRTIEVDVSVRASALATTAELTDVELRVSDLVGTSAFTDSIKDLLQPAG